MTIFLHELKRGWLALLIWSAAIAWLLGLTAMIFPIMLEEMKEIQTLLESLGDLAELLGITDMMSGDFLGYFAGEYTETLGLGGGIYAALTAVAILAGEENNHTAEFLLTHPVSRNRVVTEKALSVFARVSVLNLAATLVSVIAALAVGAEFDLGKLLLISLSAYILQIEIAAVCLMVSALLPKGGTAIALGVTIGGYFVNVISMAAEELEWLKYLTPFSYASGAYINENGSIEIPYLCVGLAITVLSIFVTYFYYNKKEIK
jgi:ABC-2 type transport system permease protein